MTTYKEIRGTNIEVLETDPSNPLIGQVWYNSTDNVVKGFYIDPGSWATGGNMNAGRNSNAGVGPMTAALAFGRDSSDSTGKTEAYDGTTWTAKNNMNTSRGSLGGAGTVSYTHLTLPTILLV